MKKSVAVVALNPRNGSFYTKEIESLFGAYIEAKAYSVQDGSATGKLPRADLFVISTDAYGSAEEVSQHIPIDCQSMAIEVSFRKKALEELWNLPKGTKALFVSTTEIMTQEAIAQLAQLGVNHIDFIPFYKGAILKGPVELAVTVNEEHLIPPGIKKVINLDHRSCTSGMMIEMALRLGLENLLETPSFQAYFNAMATTDYSFNQIFARSRKLESQFQILMEILDEGIIGVNEQGEIFACNKKACQITKVAEHLVLGRRGEEVFPFIPFYSVLKEKKEIPIRVTHLYGADISFTIMPVLRHNACIGAFATLQRLSEVESRQNALRSQLLQKGHYAKYTFADIVGNAPNIIHTKEILTRMAATDSAILIIGETGTGKELLAHAVHTASKRKAGPFIAINVAAMPENLLESELFGYAEGAFTGARKGGRPGLFEFAHQGTIFLDELEGMSSAMQVKLLRVLQEGEVMRVGGSTIFQVDVRVVAATNESIEQKVASGKFRKDLYYRLNALTVVVPPLRDRSTDILLLLEKFRKDLKGTFTLSAAAKNFLLHYSWPGNIRELRNAAEYFIFTGKSLIGIEDLPPTMHAVNAKPSAEPLPLAAAKNATPPPALFVLGLLSKAARKSEFIGRDKIQKAAREQTLLLSQIQIRTILQALAKQGLAQIGKGRSGTKILPAGEEYWRKHQYHE